MSAVALTGEEAGDELLLMGLRLDEGVDLARVARFWGRPIPERAIDRLVEQGLVWRRGRRVGLHQSGRLVADRVALEIASAS
jgi:oxygen-independent coproporphyrinogen-3 oxidase